MESSAGARVTKTPRFVVVAAAEGIWASVQGIRLSDGEAAGAIAEVRELLPSSGTTVVSWWLSELTTPADVEQQLLDAGLELVADDYLLDGLLATVPPPAGPPDVEVRLVATAEEWVDVRQFMDGIFDNPPERRPTRDALLAEFEQTTAALFGAWLDGELVGSAGATPSSRGMLLWGGSVRPDARGRGCYRALVRARWDDAVRRGTPALAVNANDHSSPALRKLGFEKVLQFRRIEDVLDAA
jgi:GNAT superfamily N-acetyltransferase